jgi:hypothetical protein
MYLKMKNYTVTKDLTLDYTVCTSVILVLAEVSIGLLFPFMKTTSAQIRHASIYIVTEYQSS